jgi:immune inhibitor A
MAVMNPDAGRNRTVLIVVAILALALCLCCCLAGLGFWLYVRALPEPVPPVTSAPLPSDFRPPPRPGTAESTLVRDLARQLAETPTTNTDYWQLHGQLVSMTGRPEVRGAVQEPPDYQVGEVHLFWIGDEERHKYWQTDAELTIKTDHAYLYVSQGAVFSHEQLQRAADLFESQIYPTNRRYFGSEWSPGIDNDPRITILVTDQLPDGIAGYFSSTDEYPLSMKPRSNQREMIYVTSDYLEDLALFGQLLSHEFQHMIHWNQDQSEGLWVNEALSELAEEINGYENVLGSWQYWFDPDIQLTNWAEDPQDRYRNYAASKLFLSYLSEHYGGYEILADLAADDAYGIDGVEHLLRSRGYNANFETVFGDWVVANLVADPGLGDGAYSYTLQGGAEPAFRATLGDDDEYAGWVSQFGADYIEIDPSAGASVTFEGSGLVELAPTELHDGAFAWWSNRRNMLSSSLTRPVDLGQVEEASLHFWTWFDLEEHFDYGYVAVSSDNGETWTTLPGTHTTADDPNQANYGNGYTGKSGAWLEETVDLTPYAGGRVLLRFWSITDPGLNQPGWLVDDIAIPEIGFYDDAERGESSWTSDGFVRSSNVLFQSYLVRLVEYGPQTTVRSVELDAANHGRFQLANSSHRAVIIISGATRWTSEVAPYRVTVTP